uniref:Methionine synthase reductase n=1 Tax=Ditylenchus dipsaci TaxID=166011 RepID=A0A915ETN2_9BILA
MVDKLNLGACLLRGSEELSSESNLRVPMLPKSKLKYSLGSNDFIISSVRWQNGFGFPGTKTGKLINAKVTANSDVSKPQKSTISKPKRYLTIQLPENDPVTHIVLDECDAGDSFYFVFPNSDLEISIMADRLRVSPESLHKNILSSVNDDLDGNSSIPGYVPNPCSLDYLLRWCLDIRRSPSRPLLRALAQHTKDPKEQRRLLELCSVQGSEEFTKYVRMSGISLVDLLMAFPSCQPSISLLIEMIPRLLPRAYTVACHKSKWGCVLRFVYSLLQVMPAENGIQFARYGACSGWMKTLQTDDIVQIILKEPSKFRLPPLFNPGKLRLEDITSIPLIMVGPGTGIAPFIAFLEKIRYLVKEDGQNKHRVRRILLYGSSNFSEEFLFESELKAFVEEGILTDLLLCESRPLVDTEEKLATSKPKYVQDGLKSTGKQICEYMLNSEINEKKDSLAGALFFACGDVKAMSKSLWACLGDILQTHQGYTPHSQWSYSKNCV